MGETSRATGRLPPGLRRDSGKRGEKGAETVQKDKKHTFLWYTRYTSGLGLQGVVYPGIPQG